MAQLFLCNSPSEFDELVDKHNPQIIYFTAAKDADSGLSWCSDCINAEPLINSIFENAETAVVVVKCIVDRIEYRSPQYLYRLHPLVHLQCVPTLLKIVNGKAIIRLNDEQCQNSALLSDFMESWLCTRMHQMITIRPNRRICTNGFVVLDIECFFFEQNDFLIYESLAFLF